MLIGYWQASYLGAVIGLVIGAITGFGLYQLSQDEEIGWVIVAALVGAFFGNGADGIIGAVVGAVIGGIIGFAIYALKSR